MGAIINRSKIAKELINEITRSNCININYNNCVMFKMEGRYKYLTQLSDMGKRKLPIGNYICIYVCGIDPFNYVIMNSEVKGSRDVFYINARKLKSIDESLCIELKKIYNLGISNYSKRQLGIISELFNNLNYTGIEEIDKLINKGRTSKNEVVFIRR